MKSRDCSLVNLLAHPAGTSLRIIAQQTDKLSVRQATTTEDRSTVNPETLEFWILPELIYPPIASSRDPFSPKPPSINLKFLEF